MSWNPTRHKEIALRGLRARRKRQERAADEDGWPVAPRPEELSGPTCLFSELIQPPELEPCPQRRCVVAERNRRSECPLVYGLVALRDRLPISAVEAFAEEANRVLLGDLRVGCCVRRESGVVGREQRRCATSFSFGAHLIGKGLHLRHDLLMTRSVSHGESLS